MPRAVVSMLFGSTLKIAVVGVVAVGLVVGGGFAVGVFGVPDLVGVDNTFGDVTDETTTIETDLHVSNPNPIGIDLQDVSINYTVSMNEVEMAHGEREGVKIASGNSTVELETAMRNGRIPAWWTSHVENDERTTIGIDATVTSDLLGRSATIERSHEIQTDILDAFNSEETRPVNADHALVDDPVLYVNETRGRWGTVSDAETPIEMEFVVYNPNLEPYVITQLGYEITMNGIDMGEGRTHREHVIPSHGSETVPLTTTIENQNLDDWWVSHLDEEVHGHQASELRIEFSAVIELPTGDEIRVPLDELTYEESIETDVFEEGDDVRESTDGSGDGGDSDEDDGSADEEGDGHDDTPTEGGGDEGSTDADDDATATETDGDDTADGETATEGDDGDDSGGIL